MWDEIKYFKKLGPADQLALETQVQKAKKEELEEVYKETKAREAVRKHITAVDVIGIICAIGLIIALMFIAIVMDVQQSAIKTAGLDICKVRNATYKDTDFSGFLGATIICTNNIKVKLP